MVVRANIYGASADPARASRSLQRPPLKDRYVLTVEAQPHVDAIKSLRALLKTMLRHYGLRCTSVRRAP
jgi:hypothetical protein